MWDNVPGRAAGGDNEKYVVLQVVLTEKLFGTGSGVTSLTNLQTRSTGKLLKATDCIPFRQLLQAPRDFLEEIKFRLP